MGHVMNEFSKIMNAVQFYWNYRAPQFESADLM